MEFRINYEQVVGQAEKIQALAVQLDSNVERLEGLMDEVRNSWKSPASETYLKQCELLIAQMSSTSFKIENVANTITNIANQIQREDKAAAERAKGLASQSGR